MMNLYKNILSTLLLSLILFGCNPLKQLQTAQVDAENEYKQGNYELALEKYSALITKYQQSNVEVPYSLYLNAATSAFSTNKYDEAINYYQSALKDSVTLATVKGLIEASEHTSNNSLSETLDKYAGFLKENGAGDYYQVKVFDNAVRSGNQDNIVSSYKNLTKPTESQSMEYINALETLGRKKEAIKFCNNLVTENKDFYKAKEYKALYYYNYAENWYKSEMTKYNKDKNYTAYVYLKRELKKISANYKIAKNEYEALSEKYPTEKKYIKYLKNIYLRLEMKKEAAEMDKLLK